MQAVKVEGEGWSVWWPILAGLGVLYVPAYVDVFREFTTTEYGTHGPVMLGLMLWLFWRERRSYRLQLQNSVLRNALGVSCLAVGLVLYAIGRSQSVHQLSIISQIPVMAGIGFLLLSPESMRKAVFPISLTLFLIPVPGSVLEMILGPLKEWVSPLVDMMLYTAGYPIARNGVVLTIGSYTLLIADACSGLNSMIALTGIGLLYVHLMKLPGRTARWVLLLSLLPVAFLVNLLRVLLLVLVTYYSGDAAGQSFHDYAGLLEIFVAFLILFVLHRMLTGIFTRAPRAA